MRRYCTGLDLQCLFFIYKIEKELGGQLFTSNEEVIAQTDAHFENLPKPY